MPFYGDNSDFKLAGTRIVLAELVIPTLLFTISGIFLASWIFLLDLTTTDLISFEEPNYLILIPEIVMVYAFVDLILACFLYSAVIRLNCSMCLAWIIFQVLLLFSLSIPLILLICPYLALGSWLTSIFWEWILVCGIVCLYKIYRIRVMCFLMVEMKEEGRVWKHGELYE